MLALKGSAWQRPQTERPVSNRSKLEELPVELLELIMQEVYFMKSIEMCSHAKNDYSCVILMSDRVHG